MRISSGRIYMPVWLVIITVAITLTVAICLWYYFLDQNDTKLVGLIGGLASGLLIFVLTFVLSVEPLRRLDRYEQMGLINVLNNRHDKMYYTKALTGVSKVVKVMGASCTRFVDDFLDSDNDDHILIDALRRHNWLSVKLLIPDDAHISNDAAARLPAMVRKLQQLQTEFGTRVELRRMPERAHHSFIIADTQLIAGPVFEGDHSRMAPAVHIKMSTRYAQKYEEYFDSEWNGCVH